MKKGRIQVSMSEAHFMAMNEYIREHRKMPLENEEEERALEIYENGVIVHNGVCIHREDEIALVEAEE